MEHFEIASLSLLPPPISLRVSLTPTVLDSYYSFFCICRAVWVPARLPSVRWVWKTTSEVWVTTR